ncbi:MAG: 23S rRNA (uracil(1939)-C(5))-methyltransferase, partial [Proteobacteria bacterium]|nr:23S rRNA (uracil(1939)-C(5))-methyltransferase [Pseudomonadota bacterium]
MARRRFPEGLIVPIDRLDEQGYGVGQVENRSIRLKNALPGEQATARILKRRRTELLGECHVWQNPNELRRHAPCEYFPRCGGCSLQHLNYADQLAFKTEGLLRELETCGITPDRLMQPVAGPRFGYRHKARLSVRYLQGEMLVGFAETLSSRVGRMDACLNLAPRLSALIPHLKARLSDLSVAQHIPQVEVAAGEQAVAIIIRHLAALSRDDEEVLRQLARSQGISVYLQAGGYDSLQKLFPLTEDDLLSYSINGFGLNLQFHPTEFTQVNPHMNCQLVADAVASCGDLNGVRVVDLF